MKSIHFVFLFQEILGIFIQTLESVCQFLENKKPREVMTETTLDL